MSIYNTNWKENLAVDQKSVIIHAGRLLEGEGYLPVSLVNSTPKA